MLVGIADADARRPPRAPRPVKPYVEPCAQGDTWPIVESCLDKLGKIAVLYETPAVVVVHVTESHVERRRLLLYGKKAEGWVRSNLYAGTGPNAELIKVGTLAVTGGTAIRIDIGTTSRSVISLDEITTTPSMWRVVSTSVCMPGTWYCTNMVTHCEVYVAGKVYWSFRGDLFWHPSLGLRMRGSLGNAGGVCHASQSLFIEEGS